MSKESIQMATILPSNGAFPVSHIRMFCSLLRASRSKVEYYKIIIVFLVVTAVQAAVVANVKNWLTLYNLKEVMELN